MARFGTTVCFRSSITELSSYPSLGREQFQPYKVSGMISIAITDTIKQAAKTMTL